MFINPAAIQPVLANTSRFVGPALRAGTKDGIRLFGAVAGFYGAAAVAVGGAAAVGGAGYGVYRGARKVAPAVSRFLQNINPIAYLADHMAERRLEELLQSGIVAYVVIPAAATTTAPGA
jgi:hypothetical protein